MLKDEAEEAETEARHAARRLAEAEAAGFDSYEAMQEAETKARRSAAAKKAAETRKRYAKLGFYKTPEQRAAQAAANRRQEVIDSLLPIQTDDDLDEDRVVH